MEQRPYLFLRMMVPTGCMVINNQFSYRCTCDTNSRKSTEPCASIVCVSTTHCHLRNVKLINSFAISNREPISNYSRLKDDAGLFKCYPSSHTQ